MLPSAGQTPEYFPLQVGNVWVYKVRGMPPPDDHTLTVTVTGVRTVGSGVTYSVVEGYRAGKFLLRGDGMGRVYEYDEASGRERLWYDFSRREGEVYETALPTCCGRARVAGTRATKEIALGLFENVLHQLNFPGVFQLGITEEDFLPYVGLIYRSENVGGPAMREMELEYARIAGATVVNASGVGFGVTGSAGGMVRLFLNNNTGRPLQVVFSSGQTFEVVVRDREGRVAYRWSEGKGFTQALRNATFGPGETSWAVLVPGLDRARGPFTVEAELVTVGGKFRGSAVLPEP
jgi:hypothetical protein